MSGPAPIPRRLATVLLVAALTACGGGDGSPVDSAGTEPAAGDHRQRPAAAEGEAGGEDPRPRQAGKPSPDALPIARTDLGTVRGVVVDQDTGEPIAGIEIVAATAEGALDLMTGKVPSAWTASDGSFEIAGIPPGEVFLMGQKPPQYALFQHATAVAARETIEERIELQRVRGRIRVPVMVAGVVRDEVTGEPIAGVRVSAGPRTRVTSDEEGHYFIRKARVGTLDLVAEHADYHAFSAQLIADKPGKIDRDISIQPITTGSILGVAVDRTTGEPLAGAIVTIAGQRIETDAEGRFRIDQLEAGEITVQAASERYRAASSQVVLEARSTAEARLELDPITEGTVAGIVRDASTGDPLGGARVRIGLLTAETEPDGRFELDNVPAGEANITADKAVYEPRLETLEVIAADSIDVQLALAPITYGSLVVIVQDATTGKPIADGTVRLTGGESARTDVQGRVRFDGVSAGRGSVSAERHAYRAGQKTFELEPAAELEQVVRLEPVTVGVVEGLVMAAGSGKPVPGAEVTIGDQRVISDAAGRFRFEEVGAGDAAVTARKAVFEPASRTIEIIAAESVTVELELEPIKIGTVVGFVVDAKTGEPIVGARVAVAGKSLETDAQGRFRLKGVTAGALALSARHADYGDGAASGNLTGAGTLELEFRLDLRREDVTELESALASKGSIDLYGIHFDSGKDRFKPSSLATLNAVLEVIKRAPAKTFRIAGHTDSDGMDASNQDLSERRAGTVIDWLVQRGIESYRLQLAGYGESRPAAPNDTPSGKALNRRVELGYAH